MIPAHRYIVICSDYEQNDDDDSLDEETVHYFHHYARWYWNETHFKFKKRLSAPYGNYYPNFFKGK